MAERKINIAIDGPAASGKSSTAKLVAKRLGFIYVDTGAMYRAATLAARRAGVNWKDPQAIVEVVERSHIELKRIDGTQHTFLDGEDVSRAIRQPVIDKHVSDVASNGPVRALLVARQREMARDGGVVMDGRDIGTVVLPDAELKVFMVASIDARAKRRIRELQAHGEEVDAEAVKKEIRRRDEADQNRKDGPLKKADDARVLDNSNLTVGQQVEQIVRWANEIVHPA